MLDVDNRFNLHKGAAVGQDDGIWASASAGDELLVILASGPEDGGKRATLALSAACSAAALGRRTRLFLVGDGAYWAYQREGPDVHVPGFPPLDLLFHELPELGGEILLCSAYDSVCSLPEGARGHRRGVVLGGFASMLSPSSGVMSVCF